ncbi:DUF896 domain-containing protein [Planococcus maitriensis]|uniref:UPF0291 protein DP119_01580 n=1 Tax=Planococcus maitriensis TaxID=221799 RepID=A0A365K9B9_9BACL|nr:DUF896 domain-containing protein [Planococcus maitriensis]RAZ69376.1 DUF896 family protein [Planococcus maitriensis]
MIKILPRINELAQKERSCGLSYEEIREQQVLRREYLQEIRGQVESTVTNMTVIDPLGADVTPGKVKNLK